MADPRPVILRISGPLAVVCAAAAWVVGAVLGGMGGRPLALTISVGAVLTALAVGLPLYAQRVATRRAVNAERLAEDAAVAMQLVLGDALEPLAHLLGRITDRRHVLRGRDTAELQGQAKALVLAAAAGVLGTERLRAAYFVLGSESPRRLTPASFHGRAEAPHTVFLEGTALGDYALGMVDRREDLFVPDVLADPPPGWSPDGREYRTFIAVPVATEARSFGLLTVDALEVGDLSEQDVAAVRVLARLLAVALNA
jgi:hypothetical protein